MVYKKSGFTLLEISIAIFLFSILSLLIFDFMRVLNVKDKLNLEATIALDRIKRDIISARRIDINKKVFQIHDKCIGFIIKNNNLIRLYGEYDFNSYTWLTRVDSMLCKVEEFNIKSLGDKIQCSLRSNGMIYEVIVKLRNL